MTEDHVLVAIDVGSTRHRVAVQTPGKPLVEEFYMDHTPEGFLEFFGRVEVHATATGLPVAVAMEGYNGHARPLDQEVLSHGWRLFNVNNLKLARFKEIFPGPAKSDPIDARKMLEMFQLQDHLPLAKRVLEEVLPAPEAHAKLKRLTRRRRVLVNEKVRVVNRLHADLQAICPGLAQITGAVDNLWFLRFLTARKTMPALARMRKRSLLAIRGVGNRYAAIIQTWQPTASFSTEVEDVGPMIQEDVHRILALLDQIAALETKIETVAADSEWVCRIRSIPGFGLTSSAELAGEIGSMDRFATEAKLALYLGMACLDDASGNSPWAKQPRQVNRRAKAAMMTATARHIDNVPESKTYYDRKRAEGKKHNQAVRSLGRHLVRVIWSMHRHQRDYELRSSGECTVEQSPDIPIAA